MAHLKITVYIDCFTPFKLIAQRVRCDCIVGIFLLESKHINTVKRKETYIFTKISFSVVYNVFEVGRRFRGL